MCLGRWGRWIYGGPGARSARTRMCPKGRQEAAPGFLDWACTTACGCPCGPATANPVMAPSSPPWDSQHPGPRASVRVAVPPICLCPRHPGTLAPASFVADGAHWTPLGTSDVAPPRAVAAPNGSWTPSPFTVSELQCEEFLEDSGDQCSWNLRTGRVKMPSLPLDSPSSRMQRGFRFHPPPPTPHLCPCRPHRSELQAWPLPGTTSPGVGRGPGGTVGISTAPPASFPAAESAWLQDSTGGGVPKAPWVGQSTLTEPA